MANICEVQNEKQADWVKRRIAEERTLAVVAKLVQQTISDAESLIWRWGYEWELEKVLQALNWARSEALERQRGAELEIDLLLEDLADWEARQALKEGVEKSDAQAQGVCA